MARGSEQATWKWAENAERICDTCSKKPLRIKDVALFHKDWVTGVRLLRCTGCVKALAAEAVAERRRQLGMAA